MDEVVVKGGSGSMKSKKGLIIVILLVILLVIAGVIISNKSNEKSKTATATKRVASVDFKNNAFQPATLVVKQGTTVTWTNEDDDILHQVAANPYPSHSDLPDLLSGKLDEEETYSYTFNKTGTFKYHDDLNPTINGTIIVN